MAWAQDETYEVAYLTPGLNVPFWKYLSDGIKQQAERDSEATGATINVTDYDSRNDASLQLQNAQDAITAGVDLIIISPTDSSSAPTVLDLAAENNVPVVIADIGTDEGEYVSFVISTNEQGAYEAGQVLMKKMKEMGCEGGDVLMITISQARLNGQNRTKGITSAVEEAGSHIVQFLQSEDYTRAEAQTQASDMLSANPQACGFFTQHDEAALGAFAALQESGRADKVAFASFDGSPESVELIKQGKLVAASMQQPVLMGSHLHGSGSEASSWRRGREGNLRADDPRHSGECRGDREPAPRHGLPSREWRGHTDRLNQTDPASLPEREGRPKCISQHSHGRGRFTVVLETR